MFTSREFLEFRSCWWSILGHLDSIGQLHCMFSLTRLPSFPSSYFPARLYGFLPLPGEMGRVAASSRTPI